MRVCTCILCENWMLWLQGLEWDKRDTSTRYSKDTVLMREGGKTARKLLKGSKSEAKD
jgi:hypothetical protein